MSVKVRVRDYSGLRHEGRRLVRLKVRVRVRVRVRGRVRVGDRFRVGTTSRPASSH